MGRDKALLAVEGTTVLERTLRVLSRLSDDILVVGRATPDDPSTARFVADAIHDVGPLGGLATGLRLARERRAICVGCDMPFLDASALAFLVARADGCDAVVPRVDGKSQPLHAVYDASIVDALEDFVAAGGRRVRAFVDTINVRWVDEDQLRAVDPRLRSHQHANTPADWATLVDDPFAI
jgi:molybdopterin-guanine dinucleotide biosynthesis protein A